MSEQETEDRITRWVIVSRAFMAANSPKLDLEAFNRQLNEGDPT